MHVHTHTHTHTERERERERERIVKLLMNTEETKLLRLVITELFKTENIRNRKSIGKSWYLSPHLE